MQLREIAALDIPRPDVWEVVIKVATDLQRRHLACWCALQVLPPANVPPIVRRYLETETELFRPAAKHESVFRLGRETLWASASPAASGASMDDPVIAVRTAAWAAVRAAVRTAVWDTAWTDARGTAWGRTMSTWGAAREAIRALAEAAAWRRQIDYALDYLEGP